MYRTMGIMLVALSACSHPKPAASPELWKAHEPRSKKAVHVGELALGTGLAASGFGGITMGVGKAAGGDGGEIASWIGVGTLTLGAISTFVSLVAFTVAAIEFESGD